MAGANTLPMFHCLQPSTLRSYAQKSAARRLGSARARNCPPANTAPILSTYRREHPPRFPQPTALPPSAHTLRNRPRPPWLRPAWDDWGRREKYGNAVLATTDGQRRGTMSDELRAGKTIRPENPKRRSESRRTLRPSFPHTAENILPIFHNLPPSTLRSHSQKSAAAALAPLGRGMTGAGGRNMEMQCLRLQTDSAGHNVRQAQSGQSRPPWTCRSPLLKAGEHCAHLFHIPQRTSSQSSTTCRPPPSAHTLRNRPRPPWLRSGEG